MCVRERERERKKVNEGTRVKGRERIEKSNFAKTLY